MRMLNGGIDDPKRLCSGLEEIQLIHGKRVNAWGLHALFTRRAYRIDKLRVRPRGITPMAATSIL